MTRFAHQKIFLANAISSRYYPGTVIMPPSASWWSLIGWVITCMRPTWTTVWSLRQHVGGPRFESRPSSKENFRPKLYLHLVIKTYGWKNYTEDATRLSETSFLAGLAKIGYFLDSVETREEVPTQSGLQISAPSHGSAKTDQQVWKQNSYKGEERGWAVSRNWRKATATKTGSKKINKLDLTMLGSVWLSKSSPWSWPMKRHRVLNSLDGLVGEQLGEGVDQLLFTWLHGSRLETRVIIRTRYVQTYRHEICSRYTQTELFKCQLNKPLLCGLWVSS